MTFNSLREREPGSRILHVTPSFRAIAFKLAMQWTRADNGDSRVNPAYRVNQHGEPFIRHQPSRCHNKPGILFAELIDSLLLLVVERAPIRRVDTERYDRAFMSLVP